MLFALPFAAVGVGALFWSGWTLLEWREIAGWAPVPAEIIEADLEEHTDSEGDTTYEATAIYRYEYAGTPVRGHTRCGRHGQRQHRSFSAGDLP